MTRPETGKWPRHHGIWLSLVLLMAAMGNTSAAVHYVNITSAHPAPPFNDWTTAARTIQDAVDSAAAGDQIVVTNGIYATGGRAVDGTMTNRVTVDKPLTLRSVNGPQFTVIEGHPLPSTTHGEGAVRCVYLTSGATLSGFTLTKGATSNPEDWWGREGSGGGVFCTTPAAMVTNCLIVGNSAATFGGGAAGGTLYDCILITNSAYYGGAAATSQLHSCRLTNNVALSGAGAWNCTLNKCVLSGNSAAWDGGGAYWCDLKYCRLIDNSADLGGGTYESSLSNCSLSGNSANLGGATAYGELFNCVLTGNSASDAGGGAWLGTLNNCTLTGNSAGISTGGASGTLNNCIIYHNTARSEPNFSNATLNFCCTTPLPSSGLGNMDSEPQFADLTHLSATSPCRGAGNSLSLVGTDIDGEPWRNPPAIGSDEWHPKSVTGPLNVSVSTDHVQVAPHFTVRLTASIDGRAKANRWSFGDGAVLSNRPYASHAWNAPGQYEVTFTAYNDTYPDGVTVTQSIRVVAAVHYVALQSVNPTPPYTTWQTAATRIQDAVEAVETPGALVLVTNGIYLAGGKAIHGTMTNRVAVDKWITLRSVNGPQFTTIQGQKIPGTTIGDGAIRCVYLTNGAVLSGFTLTGGATRTLGDQQRECSGGGVWCEFTTAVITNCVVAANSASVAGGGTYSGTIVNSILTGNTAEDGGGTAFSALINCTLSTNRAGSHGGGAYMATLESCNVRRNWSPVGGGANSSTLRSSILALNSGSYYGGGVANCTLTGCTLIKNEGGWGGGASGGKLYNCILAGNSGSRGGGAYWSELNNCTLSGNSAYQGGGCADTSLNNCIVYFNTAEVGPNYWNEGSYYGLNHCCSTPMPAGGFANITNAPLFAGLTSGDFRLQANSPCVNAGSNVHASGPTDVEGLPRIVSGTVDIGAHEFQGSGSVISYAWLQHFGLPTDGSADTSDLDGDGHDNWQEWRRQTDPTNALSVLRMLSLDRTSGTNIVVRWQSEEGVNYFLERSVELSAAQPFTLLANQLIGAPSITTFTDTNASESLRHFYRVGVQMP